MLNHKINIMKQTVFANDNCYVLQFKTPFHITNLQN